MRPANSILAFIAIITTTAATFSFAEPAVTYVGLGRYSCRGTTAECAPYEQMNQMNSERKERAYQREQDKADAYVERARHDEEKKRTEQRR